MKLTKSKLKQIIKEEMSSLQQEGVFDMFKKKKESREERLHRITKEDFLKGLGRDGASLYNTGENAEVRKSAEKAIQALVDKMVVDPSGGGPRDKYERAIRSLANEYKTQLK
jgi:hypothetical protein